MNHRLLSLLIIVSIVTVVSGCGTTDTQDSQQVTASSEANETATVQPESLPGANQRTRGLDQASTTQDRPFDQQFPTLTRVLQNESSLLSAMTDFHTSISQSQGIQSERDLMAVLETRDSSLIPRIEAALMTIDMDNSLYEDYDLLQAELQQLGMQMTFAEGMFTSVGPYRFLESQIAQYASNAFSLFLDFNQAKTESFNGEYPFLNMGPYLEMIQIGEELAAIDGNPYYEKIQDDFENALLVFSDVHQVNNPTARGEAALFVEGVSTDAYPYMTERDTRAAYVAESSGSLFQKAVEKIMANPSTMSPKPEALYLVVVEWADDRSMAKSRVAMHLRQGEDIPHHLEISLADGSKKFAIVYRFFEDVSQAEEALASIEGDFPEADLMMVSVKGESLYQIGG